MDQAAFKGLFTQEYLNTLLPETRSDEFFEALYGDASEGAYDIKLEFVSASDKCIVLAFSLTKREGKCLVCTLTYGLPNVFSRHPLINIKGMVENIKEKGLDIKDWRVGQTKEHSASLHTIPLYLNLA